jgi:hypothetical protein
MNLIAWMKQKIGWIDKMIEIEKNGENWNVF